MPKRLRSGAESKPERVVAPIRVKGSIWRRMELARGPSPVTMSMWKSSMAP
ncbi:MAG: hypothetical protein BWY73_01314 [candidate division TA06 bacterium ADurb.Bin417]|uniref:Uncharacterized protein n=1 Tax=candidate division TA06 bacterium ADurb.Bin417 TaxID=1852828 RepID=A0A1V5MBE6_UNCT6|nr:MAG: hypothetical protein BWY73_01314 [candidate division TA06 bacterium ADurb.Bin417]